MSCELVKYKVEKTMKMFLSMALIGLFLIPALQAQDMKFKSEEEYRSAVYSKDKKELMAEYLKLSEEEGEKFWQIYDLYESERRTMGDQRFSLLQKYLEEYEHIDDAQAEEWLEKIFSFRQTYMEHLQKYSRQVQANLGGTKAIQFYELETYFRNDIRDRIYSEFPFVNEK